MIIDMTEEMALTLYVANNEKREFYDVAGSSLLEVVPSDDDIVKHLFEYEGKFFAKVAPYVVGYAKGVPLESNFFTIGVSRRFKGNGYSLSSLEKYAKYPPRVSLRTMAGMIPVLEID